MDIPIILIVFINVFVLIVLIALFFLLRRISSNQSSSKQLVDVIKVLQTGSSNDRALLLSTLQQNTSQLNIRLDKAARVIGDLQHSVGEMSEIGRGIRELQLYLTSPKFRGNLGEQLLSELLAEILPSDSYEIQYQFRTGKIADAVIKTSKGIIPIDAKFPLSSYRLYIKAEQSDVGKKAFAQFNKDVKKHISDIALKYRIPEENTTDFLIMYVPSETIYYEIIRSQETYEFAMQNNVLLVSPVTFYAYLQAILASMQGKQIESQAKQILILLRSILTSYEKSGKQLSIVNKHLSNAYSASNQFTIEFDKLGSRLDSTKTLTSATTHKT